MESIVRNSMVIKLVLNASEASLLKALVQNSHPDEPEDITKFKEELFNLIPPFKKLHEMEE